MLAESLTSWLFDGKFGFQLYRLFEEGVDIECSKFLLETKFPFLKASQNAAAVLLG